MTRSTSALAAALCLGLLVPVGATQAQTASSAPAARTCRGDTLTLAWGAVVRDHDGPCRIAPAPRRAAVTRAAPRSAMLTCHNARSYLGGALQICDDQPRARSPR